MLNNIPRSWIYIWSAIIAVAVGIGLAQGVRISTSALLLVIGVAPGVVLLALQTGPHKPTVAEMLHTRDEKSGR